MKFDNKTIPRTTRQPTKPTLNKKYYSSDKQNNNAIVNTYYTRQNVTKKRETTPEYDRVPISETTQPMDTPIVDPDNTLSMPLDFDFSFDLFGGDNENNKIESVQDAPALPTYSPISPYPDTENPPHTITAKDKVIPITSLKHECEEEKEQTNHLENLKLLEAHAQLAYNSTKSQSFSNEKMETEDSDYEDENLTSSTKELGEKNDQATPGTSSEKDTLWDEKDSSEDEEKEEEERASAVSLKDFKRLNKLLDETVECFKKTYDVKTGKKLIRRNKIKQILTKKEKNLLIKLLGKKFPSDLQFRLEKLAEQNLEIMNVVGYFSMRLIQYCANPIKFFCEEF